MSLSEALWRVEAFADAGADVLFIDALESVDEMRAFCSLGEWRRERVGVREGTKAEEMHKQREEKEARATKRSSVAEQTRTEGGHRRNGRLSPHHRCRRCRAFNP